MDTFMAILQKYQRIRKSTSYLQTLYHISSWNSNELSVPSEAIPLVLSPILQALSKGYQLNQFHIYLLNITSESRDAITMYLTARSVQRNIPIAFHSMTTVAQVQQSLDQMFQVHDDYNHKNFLITGTREYDETPEVLQARLSQYTKWLENGSMQNITRLLLSPPLFDLFELDGRRQIYQELFKASFPHTVDKFSYPKLEIVHSHA